jgi:DNA-binding MarR family transcriptional regulator
MTTPRHHSNFSRRSGTTLKSRRSSRKAIRMKFAGAKRNPTRGGAGSRAARHDFAFREFVAELFAAAAGMQSLRRAIARSVGLGGAELAVLLAVWRLEQLGPIGIKGIAGHLHVAGPHVTDEVVRLVHVGYLQKSQDSRDTRAVVLNLTKRGKKLLASLKPTLDEINLTLFAGITADDMRVLRNLFRRLIHGSAISIEQLRGRR